MVLCGYLLGDDVIQEGSLREVYMLGLPQCGGGAAQQGMWALVLHMDTWQDTWQDTWPDACKVDLDVNIIGRNLLCFFPGLRRWTRPSPTSALPPSRATLPSGECPCASST